MKDYFVYKLVGVFIVIAAIIWLIDIAFSMMNSDSTILFIAGIILLILCIGIPIEYLIKKFKK